jgi:hypothetical protein
MLNRIALGLFVAGLATAGAATYRVSFYQDSMVNGQQLKAGDYKLEVNNNTATLKKGKQTIEVPVHEETAPSKFPSTQLQYVENNKLQEIRLGGTNTKLVFGNGGTAAGGMQ